MLKKVIKTFCITCIIIAVGCDSDRVFDEYQSVVNQWHKDDVKTFKFNAPDTTNQYNLFINIRNNNDFKYNNLFLIAELNYPNGKTTTDTLEYRMANAQGELLGKGFTDVKENKLWFKGHKSSFSFTENGDYTVRIQHAMRENGIVLGEEKLEGITDVGFRIEQTEH